MSKNRNRAKLNKAETGRDYKTLLLRELYPPYYDECWGYHRRNKNPVIGSKNYRCWKRKQVLVFQYRMYRTWKHNRKTRWK